MSKRVGSTDLQPIKLARVDDVWTLIADDEPVKDFKPVESGPKTKLPKSFLLNYQPRTEVTITLNGYYPEVRFTTPDGRFYMSGDEFLHVSGSPHQSSSLDMVCLEPTESDGFRLARYKPTESGMPHLLPITVLDINKFAAKRLKSKLDAMRDHVCALKDTESVIRAMFDCVEATYRSEYQLEHSLIPITDQFPELSRIVETYISPVVIVKAFLEKLHEQGLSSRFNYYSLCSVICSQKHTLIDLLK